MNTDNYELRKQLDEIKEKYNLLEPNRGNLDDDTIHWLGSKPDYTKANLEYFKGKKMNHAAESLNKLVEDLVKTWEMEASHKKDFSQWTTVDHASYKIRANGGKFFSGEESKEKGNYNVLLVDCPKHIYDANKEDFKSSHELFRNAFSKGFPWELIQVFSGPPKVSFSWRHWGNFDGIYNGNLGDGSTVELYGFAIVKVNDELKIQKTEVFYKPEEFLEVLEGKRSNTEISNGKSIIGGKCPFINRKKDDHDESQ